MAIQSRFWKIFDLILLVIVLVIGAWALRSYFLSQPGDRSALQGNFTVYTTIDAGKGEKIEIPVGFGSDPMPTEVSVLGVLRSAVAERGLALDIKEYPGMGSLVDRIGETANGEKGAYWQFWVNGQYGDKSADNVFVKAGDRIEWKYSSSTQ